MRGATVIEFAAAMPNCVSSGASGEEPGEGAVYERGEAQLPWYALQVRPRYEKFVAGMLRNKGVEEYVPLYTSVRRWSDRSVKLPLPLFPGYVFCRLDWSRRVAPVLTTPGVLRVVGVGSTPLEVDERELQAVRAIEKSGHAARPWPMPEVGDRVYIEHGPLCGVEGVLVGLKKHRRLVVSVSLLRRSVAVEIEEHWARPVKRWTPKQVRSLAASSAPAGALVS